MVGWRVSPVMMPPVMMRVEHCRPLRDRTSVALASLTTRTKQRTESARPAPRSLSSPAARSACSALGRRRGRRQPLVRRPAPHSPSLAEWRLLLAAPPSSLPLGRSPCRDAGTHLMPSMITCPADGQEGVEEEGHEEGRSAGERDLYPVSERPRRRRGDARDERGRRASRGPAVRSQVESGRFAGRVEGGHPLSLSSLSGER